MQDYYLRARLARRSRRRLLREHEEARPLSGGMTLIPDPQAAPCRASHLIDLTRIDALRGDRRARHAFAHWRALSNTPRLRVRASCAARLPRLPAWLA